MAAYGSGPVERLPASRTPPVNLVVVLASLAAVLHWFLPQWNLLGWHVG